MRFQADNGQDIDRVHALIERDADPLVAAPDRMAAADELVSLYHQPERRRQVDAACEFKCGAFR
jgi:hypothetical protein